MTAIFSMNQKKGSDSRLYCKMEPKRGGRFFHTSRGVSGKPVSFLRIKSDDGFDQPDRSNGQKVLRIFIEILIFFQDMGDEAEIPLDKDVFCFEVSFRVLLDVILLFRRGERTGK